VVQLNVWKAKLKRFPFSNGRPKGTPTVVFLDGTRWAAFHQLSPQLRRAGLRTIRVTTGNSSRSWLTSRLVYDRCVFLSSLGAPELLRKVLNQENVVDVQFVETLSELMELVVDVLSDEVANRVRHRHLMMDKWKASVRFRENGIQTPDTVTFNDATPEQAVEEFGLPVVVKDRTGCGGSGVAICGDISELRRAHADFSSRGSRSYYERFVDGEKLNYAAVYSSDGLEQELAYQVTRWVPPVGTGIEVVTIEDPSLISVGRIAVEVSNCLGFMNMDVIRDAEGSYWLIDFNARAFGGGTNFLLADLDLSQGYLRSIHWRSATPERQRPDTGIVVEIFPTCLIDAMRTGSYAVVARSFVKSIRPYIRGLGFRYAMSEALTTIDTTRRFRNDPTLWEHRY
jgi:hypothetical protein